MLQIMLPMSRATMITIAMFSFIAHWTSYFWPLVYDGGRRRASVDDGH
jgi:ABC-type glycerol-3-phosphate transport system permease component